MLFLSHRMSENLHLSILEYGDPLNVVQSSVSRAPHSATATIEVRIDAAPINPADINLIQGTYGVKPPLPCSLGLEGSGTILASPHIDFPEGAQVVFLKRVGSWSEKVFVSPDDLLVLNAPIDPLQASMLKVNPMTAWRLLKGFSTLQQGDYVIQNAANSGVGQCVIQIAKLLGLRTINLVRREELFPILNDAGADHVFLDHSDSVNQIKALTGEDLAPKLAFNAVGGDSALRLMDCLALQGKHITYGAMSKRSLKVPNKFLIFKRISLHGLWITEDLKELPKSTIESSYQQLAEWIRQGKLIQPIEAVYPLKEYKDALEHHLQAHKNGKILFQPA